jgi:hypothetical protein
MRASKLIITSATALMLIAIAPAAASAEVEFLPGKAGTPFTDSSGKAVLNAGTALPITCEKSKSTDELLSSKEALMVIGFEECLAGGLGAHTIGDALRTILVHVEAKGCYIKELPFLGGLLLKPLPVTIEVPASKLTITVEGDVIARVLPEKVEAELFTLDLNAPSGVQEYKECKDGLTGMMLKEDLKAKLDAEPMVLAALEVKGADLLFTKANAQTWDL